MDAQSHYVNSFSELRSVPTWPGTLTVLRTTGSALATKRWIWRTALGEWSKCSYQAGALFHPKEYPIASLRDLGSVLERVSRDPHAFVVRGGLAPWVREEMAQGQGRPIRRRKLKKGDADPSLVEVPCPWLMIDIDNFPLRLCDDLTDDPASAIEHAISELPLSRRASIWQALEDLLTGPETHTGRLEIRTRMDAAGSSRVILLHTRRDLQEAVTAGPLLVLDATMPTRIVRHYLPRLEVLADLQAAAPYLDTFQIVGGWGKTSILQSSRASLEENCRRDRTLQELRDFVVFHSGGNALVVTYEAIEDRFSDLPGVRTGHFNKIAGLDTFGDVRGLFVIGRPLPRSEIHRRMALALTGRPIPDETPHQESRGLHMSDGTAATLQIRAYTDPDLETLRVAITDAAVLQAAGRGRAVNRTAETPLSLLILADVVVPMPVKRIARWADVRLSPQQRMAARGMATDSPTDAWRLYPDLFPSAEAAKQAFHRGISVTFPYECTLIGECHRNRITEGKYRPQGRGQQLRRMWVLDWRLPSLREEMEEVLGPLAMFDVASATAAKASPLPEPAAIAALSGADKLVMRARLQVGRNPLLLRAAAPEARHGYGDGLDPRPAVSRRSCAAGALGPVDDQVA